MISPDLIPLEPGQPALLLLDGEEEERCALRPCWEGWVAERLPGLVWLEAPLAQAAALPLAGGQELHLQTWRQTDALYVLRARVVRVEVGSRLRVALEPLDGWRKQDRQYMRVPINLPLKNASVDGPLGRESLGAAHVRDLSANGLRLSTDLRLWVGESVDLRLRLPRSYVALPLRARVVRVLPHLSSELEPWESGATLCDLEDDARDALIRFAIHTQQEWRRSERP